MKLQRPETDEIFRGRAYDEAGHLHAAASREQASADLIDRWDRDREGYPDASSIILTHTNDAVHDLNLAARERLRGAGELGEDVTVAAERGRRAFATGDRIMFLKNERSMGVKNGSLGTVQNLTQTRMAVMLDDGRSIAFDIKDYNQIDHGYAATIHKAQGVTVDRVHVLATPGLDRHAAYVALSRHRDRVDLHYGRDDFADQGKLVRVLSRERAKDMASDYTRDFADRREIRLPAPAVENGKATPARSPFAGLKLNLGPLRDIPASGKGSAEPKRDGRFAGLKLNTASLAKAPEPRPLDQAVARYGRAVQDVMRMHDQGLQPLAHQTQAMNKAVDALNAVRAHGAQDLYAAIRKDPALVGEAANGRTARAIQAMLAETDLRLDVGARADRFVADWQQRARLFRRLENDGDYARAERVKDQLNTMAKSLHRDPQLESLLRQRTKELGIRPSNGGSISQDLHQWVGRSRSRGRGL